MNSISAFVVVDLQNDFFENGTLPVLGATALLPQVTSAIAAASEAGWLIFFTRDWHPPHHTSFQAQGGPWPSHCVAESAGAEFHPDLLVPPKAIIVSKGESLEGMGYSPFENEEFVKQLEELRVKRLVVVGVALEYCVKATCMNARARGYDVVAVKSMIASVSEDAAVIEEQWQILESSGVTIIRDRTQIAVT